MSTVPAGSFSNAALVGENVTLRFAPGTRDLLVDGAPQATASGQVTVACGKHWVKVGAAFGRTIDVPCGGAASVQ